MDLRQLQYFLRVKECGSFTAAAELLHVAQPSLSRQIRLLERELGHRLLIRHGRGVIATEAGKLLAEHSKIILRQVSLARQAFERMDAGKSGHLTIGLPSSLVKLVSVPLLEEFRKRLPDVSISISDGFSISMQEWLLRGQLDIALMYKALPTPGITRIPVLDEELFLFSRASGRSKCAPISLMEVAQLPLVLPKSPHEIRVLVDTQMASLGCKPNVIFEVDSIPATLHLLRPAEQFTILPKYAVSIYARLDAYVWRQIIKPNLYSKLVLATAENRPRNPLYDSALGVMADICASALQPIKALECAQHRHPV
jgi:LysR family transcriptional regulator, nitrogen assimilation regulatory protein